MSLNETQKKIKDIILAGKPALIARFGGNEARCTVEYIGIKLGVRKKFSKKSLKYMHMNAGVFPEGNSMLERFGAISEHAAKQVDVLAWWPSILQEYLIDNTLKKEALLTSLEDLEPYYSSEPWSAALKEKRILVIHPFKESIESQYNKHKLLFENPDVLPEFELKVLKAVQTIAGEKDERFNDWEEALNYMFEEAMKIEFDIAIIGCGAYGMPLAAKIKEAGKIAIHLGGATQLLFGIKGARWDNHRCSVFFNEYWIRPGQSEIPEAAKKIENACYW